MKTLALIILALISINTFATKNLDKTNNAVIDHIFCGEWDAYYIGDACILFLEEENSQTIVIYDIDEFTYFLDEHNIQDFRELSGQNIQFKKQNYQVVSDKNLLYEFKNYEKDQVLEHNQTVDIQLN